MCKCFTFTSNTSVSIRPQAMSLDCVWPSLLNHLHLPLSPVPVPSTQLALNKCGSLGWLFDTAVKMPLGMLTPHIGVPSASPPLLLIPDCCSCAHGRQQMMTQILES